MNEWCSIFDCIWNLLYDLCVNVSFSFLFWKHDEVSTHPWNCLQITLEVVPSLEDYELHNVQLGLGGEHQRINAALAVALCKKWVMTRAPSEHTTGLQKVSL